MESPVDRHGAQSSDGRLIRERDHLQLLLDVNNAVVSHLNLRELLTAISACLRRVVPHDLASLALYDPETRQFRVPAYFFSGHEDFLKEGELVPIQGTPLGIAFTSGQPVIRRRIDLAEFPANLGSSRA